MAVNSKLNFDIFARDHASPVFNKFGKEVDRSSKSAAGHAGTAKKLIGAFAGYGVISKAADFMRGANEEARESQKVNAQTSAALKSTGASAWASTKGIGALAASISNKSGIDDEAIQSGENLLLTFKNVRNEAGKGSKIFDRATQSAVDLSAAGFGSIEGASKMLGKALNDPIKGISALGRAGVTFTASQKKQIETMVKAGDTLGAQKIIMKEVESQVKGSAAAQATSADKLKVSWANYKEEIGTKLLPVMDKMADAGTKSIAWIKSNPGAVKAFGVALGVLGGFALYAAAGFIAAQIAIFAVPLALAALVGGLVYAYTKFGWFKTGVDTFIKAIGAAFAWLWNNAVQPALKLIVGALGWLLIAWGKMLQGLSHVPGFGWAKKAGDVMEEAGRKALGLRDDINKIPTSHTFKIDTRGLDNAISKARTLADAVRAYSVKKNALANPYIITAHGSPENARGTSNWRGGITWVGEEGPELLDLPKGSRITPADESVKRAREDMAPTGYFAPPSTEPTGSALHIENFHAGGLSARDVADELLWVLRR